MVLKMEKDFTKCKNAKEFLKEYPKFEELPNKDAFLQRQQELDDEAKRLHIKDRVWAAGLEFSDGFHYFTRKGFDDLINK